MTVPLLREPISGGARVLTLPAWVGPGRAERPRATYWHRPRSATLFPDGRVAISLWCGQTRHVRSIADAVLTDDAPEDLKCGTCVGRLEGHRRDDGLIFAPRDQFALPARCPGEYDPDDFRRCFACGAKVGAARGWWASGIAQHRPAPELAERCRPCPRHGWTLVRARDDRLVCVAWAGGEGACEAECGPVG